jgi:hypothetical protein
MSLGVAATIPASPFDATGTILALGDSLPYLAIATLLLVSFQ